MIDAQGNLAPEHGTEIPTRAEFSELIQQIVESVNSEGVEQPLVERLAQYLDAIYDALPDA